MDRIGNQKLHMLRFFLSFIALCLLSFGPSAQSAKPSGFNKGAAEGSESYLGLFGGVDLATAYAVDFARLPGTSSNATELFTSDGGTGYAFGALYQFPLNLTAFGEQFPANGFALQLRAGMTFLRAEMSSREQALPSIDNDNNLIWVTFEHSLESELSIFAIEPRILLRPFLSPLALHAGFNLGLITSSSYRQTESIASPELIYYYDPPREEILGRRLPGASGSIEDIAALYGALELAVSYDFSFDWHTALFKSFELTPELSFRSNISSFLKEKSWSVSGLRANVIVKIPLKPAPPPLPMMAVELFGLGIDGSELANPTVEIRRSETTHVWSLLPYVFFDYKDSDLDFYSLLTRAERFSYELPFEGRRNLPASTQDMYIDVLNIIAKRLLKHPGVHISLSAGSASGKEGEPLARARMKAVRNYLSSVWGIAEDRVAMNLNPLPFEAIDNAPKAIERSVEITADNPTILAPVRWKERMTDSVKPQMILARIVNAPDKSAPRVEVGSHNDQNKYFTIPVTDVSRTEKSFRVPSNLAPKVESIPVYVDILDDYTHLPVRFSNSDSSVTAWKGILPDALRKGILTERDIAFLQNVKQLIGRDAQLLMRYAADMYSPATVDAIRAALDVDIDRWRAIATDPATDRSTLGARGFYFRAELSIEIKRPQ